MPLSPDLNGKCFAILTSSSETGECSCAHAELKLPCSPALHSTQGSVCASGRSVLVILAAPGTGTRQLLTLALPPPGKGHSGAALPDPSGSWGAFLCHHSLKNYVQNHSLIEISFLSLKILSTEDSPDKAADQAKAFLAHAELGFGSARRAAVLIARSKSPFSSCLFCFLRDPTATAALGRRGMSCNPEQQPG